MFFIPSRLFSPWPIRLLGSREGPGAGGRIAKWPLSKQERESLEFVFFWASRETRMWRGWWGRGEVAKPRESEKMGCDCRNGATVWFVSNPAWYGLPHGGVGGMKS